MICKLGRKRDTNRTCKATLQLSRMKHIKCHWLHSLFISLSNGILHRSLARKTNTKRPKWTPDQNDNQLVCTAGEYFLVYLGNKTTLQERHLLKYHEENPSCVQLTLCTVNFSLYTIQQWKQSHLQEGTLNTLKKTKPFGVLCWQKSLEVISLNRKVQHSAGKPIALTRKKAKRSKKGRNRWYFALATFANISLKKMVHYKETEKSTCKEVSYM